MKCPTCKKETEYSGNPYRPFCSDRCKLIDLGRWLDGKYQIPAVDREERNGASDEGDAPPPLPDRRRR